MKITQPFSRRENKQYLKRLKSDFLKEGFETAYTGLQEEKRLVNACHYREHFE